MRSLQSGVRKNGIRSRLARQGPAIPRESQRIVILRETHATPEWASERLLLTGGRNRFGDANLRVTWGWNLLDWVGGKFEEGDEENCLIREVLDLRMVPKYEKLLPDINRWIVEQWLPPEHYGSQENWYRQTREWGEEGNIPQLGPYPWKGRYEFLGILETPEHEFVQLTWTALEELICAWQELKKQSYQEGVIARKNAAKAKLRRDQAYAHQFLNEATKPAFNEKMYVTVA